MCRFLVELIGLKFYFQNDSPNFDFWLISTIDTAVQALIPYWMCCLWFSCLLFWHLSPDWWILVHDHSVGCIFFAGEEFVVGLWKYCSGVSLFIRYQCLALSFFWIKYIWFGTSIHAESLALGIIRLFKKKLQSTKQTSTNIRICIILRTWFICVVVLLLRWTPYIILA